jgi:hypothetical protein
VKRELPEVEVIGVPVDFGGARRGVGLAPTAFRLAGLVERVRAEGIDVRDAGDIAVAGAVPGGKARPDDYREVKRVFERLADQVRWRGRSTRAACRWSSAAITRSPWARSPASPAISRSAACDSASCGSTRTAT